MTIRACASLPYGCNQQGKNTDNQGAPTVYKFVPCGKCSAIMPCAKEFICDTFLTWQLYEFSSGRFRWRQCPDAGGSCIGACKKVDFDGDDLQLSTEFLANGEPDPTFPQHVYRVKFDSDYIRNISHCGTPTSEPCEGTRTTNPNCDIITTGGSASRRYTPGMTRSHAVFGYELDEEGNPTTTPIVCESQKVNQDGSEFGCVYERSGSFACAKEGEPCDPAESAPQGCECVCTPEFIDQEICGYFVEPACGDNTVEKYEDLYLENPGHQVPEFTRAPWPFLGIGPSGSNPFSSPYKFHIKKTRTVPSADPTTQAFTCDRTETDCGVTEEVPDCVNEISSCVQPMDSFGINVDQDLGETDDGVKYVWPKHLQFNLSSLVYSAETETEDCNIPEMDCSKGYYYENNYSAGGSACTNEVIPGIQDRKQHYINGDTPYGSDYQFPDGFPTQVDGTPFRSRGVRCKVDLEAENCNDNNRWGEGSNNKLGNPDTPPTAQFGGFSMCSPFAIWEEKQRDDLSGDGNLKRVYREACWFQGKGQARIINTTKIETEPVSVQLTAPDFQRTNPRFVEYFVDVEGLIPPPCEEDLPCGGPVANPLEPIPCLPYALNDKVDSDLVSGRPQAMRLEGGWVCKNQKYDVYYICSRAKRLTDYFLWLCCNTLACQCAEENCDPPDCPNDCQAPRDSCQLCKEQALYACGAIGGGGEGGYDQGTGGPGTGIGVSGCPGSSTTNNCGSFEGSCGNSGYKCVNISAAVNLQHGDSVSPCPGSTTSVPANQGFKKDLYIRVLLRCDPEQTHYDPLTGEASRGIIRSELTLWSQKHPKYDEFGSDDGIPADAGGQTQGWEPVTGGALTVPCTSEENGNSFCDTWDGFVYSDEPCENCYNFVLATELQEQFPSIPFPHPDSFCGCPGDADVGTGFPCGGCADGDPSCGSFNEDCLPNVFNHEWSEGLMDIKFLEAPTITGTGKDVPAGGPIGRSNYWRWGCDYVTFQYALTPGRYGSWTGGFGTPGMADPTRSASRLFCRQDCNHVEEFCLSPNCDCPGDCFCSPDFEGNLNCSDDPDPDLQCPENLDTYQQRISKVNGGDRLSKVLGVMDIRTTSEWQTKTLPSSGTDGSSAFCNRHRYGFNKFIFPHFNLFGCNYRGLGDSQLCDGSDNQDGDFDCDNVTSERAAAPMFPAYRELIDTYPQVKQMGIAGKQNGPQYFTSGLRNTTMQFAKPCTGWSKLVNELNYPVVPSGQYTYKEGYGPGNLEGEDYGSDFENYTQSGQNTLGGSYNPGVALPVGHATDRVDSNGDALPHCTYTDMVVGISGGAYEDIQPDTAQRGSELGPEPSEQYKLSYIFTKECDANWYSIDAGQMTHQSNGCAKKPTLTGGQVSFDFYDPTDQG